jgi:hypothetical protein
MIISLGPKSARHSTCSGESEVPELRGEPFETIEIVSITGGTILINLHTIDQVRELSIAVAEAASRIRARASAQQAAE